MVLVYRWSLCTGGPCVQVILVYRWSLCTGGPCLQVVLVYRWSLFTEGSYIEVHWYHGGGLGTMQPLVVVLDR